MNGRRKAQIFSLLFVFVLIVLPNFLIGQHYFRMQADFSIKEKLNDGKQSLTIGTVYYDRSHRKLVYDIRFPEKETWVIMDTAFYKIVNGEVKLRQMIPMMPESTIFEFALNNNLDNFGLENSFYTLEKVEREDDQVLTSWMPDKRLSKAFGKIIVSKKDGKLYGIAFYTPEGELVKKQLFKNFIKASGVEFPAEITEFIYKTTGRELKLSTYKNLKINELKQDAFYNFPVPGVR